MVVISTVNLRVADRMRAAALDPYADLRPNMRSMMRLNSSRLERRRRHMLERQQSRILQSKRREFFRIHNLQNVDKILVKKLDINTRKIVNTTFAINKKNLNLNDLNKYRLNSGKFVTKRVAQMYWAKFRRAMREWEHKKRVQAQKTRKYANIYRYLPVENTGRECMVTPDDMVPSKRTIVQKRRDFNPKQNFVYKSKHLVKHNPYVDLSIRNRLKLAISKKNFKYAAICSKFLEKVYHTDHLQLTNCSERLAIPQMDSQDAHGTGSVQQFQSQNVILTTENATVVEKQEKIPRWTAMTSEDTVGSFAEMTDRWHILDVLKWKSASNSRSLLAKYDLPTYVLTTTRFNNLISVRPFHNHVLWRGDIEIKIDVNSNKFQFGQLQCSFFYGWKHLEYASKYNNVYTLSQCNHGLIDAGGCNSIILNMPYKNQSLMLNIKQFDTEIDSAYMGTLFIYVLNNLHCAEGSPMEADVVINFRFKNCEFTGQIAADLNSIRPAKAQMEAMAMAGAMKLLDTYMADANRDNPPAVLPPNYVVPTATHSWSIGTDGVDVLHPLRLAQGAQTRHPYNCSYDDHSTVMDLCRIFSYVKTIQWTAADLSSTLLGNFTISPDKLESSNTTTSLGVMSLSPMTVLSNLFMQWRGSIEVRFDIIASLFHTGRLLVAFIPYVVNNVTVNQAMSSYNMQFDLQEQRSFTFVVPYVYRDMWMRREAQMDGLSPKFPSYGSMQIFVLNELNCPATVSNKIDINLYMRAGMTFELSVPIQPSIGLSFNTQYYNGIRDKFPAADGMDDAYLGFWENENLDNIIIVRWGTLAGRICEFPGVSRLDGDTRQLYWKSDQPLYITAYTIDNADIRTWSIVHFAVVKYNDYYIAIACNSATAAANLRIQYNLRDITWKSFAMRTGKINNAPWFGKKLVLTLMLASSGQGERDTAQSIIDATTGLISTNFGMLVYGESFNRLKDICRRYQFYGNFIVTPQSSDDFDAYTTIRIPVNPSGLDLDLFENNKINEIPNKCREGIIPIILSAFKYYRGSIRMRIVLTHNNVGNVWVQHRPELVPTSNAIVQTTTAKDNLNVFAHGYASYIQDLNINNIIEIEIPYYQPGMYGLLGTVNKQSLKIYNSNGLILLGFTNTNANVVGRVFYSLGDDFNFNTFQGFPSMVECTDIAVNSITEDFELMALPQMDTDKKVETPQPAPEKKKASRWSRFFGIDEALNETKNELHDTVSTTLNMVYDKFKHEGFFAGVKDFIMFAISQVCHVLANFNWKSIVIAVTAVLAKIGIVCYDKIKIVVTFVKMLICKCWPEAKEQLETSVEQEEKSTSTENIPEPEPSTSTHPDPTPSRMDKILGEVKHIFDKKAQPQDETAEKEVVAGWLSICFTAMCTFLGCKDKNLKMDTTKMANDLMSAKHLKSGNVFITFVKNHYRAFQQMYRFIVYRIFPKFAYKNYFNSDAGPAALWFKEARQLLDISLNSEESFDPHLSDRVEVCVSVGHSLMDAVAENIKGEIPRLYNDFERRVNKLRDMRDRLIARGQYAFKRQKPLHIQLSGAAGIGKSMLVDTISKFVLTEVCGMSTLPYNTTCTVKAADKYWDQCTGREPVVLLDDLWCVQTGQHLDSQIENYIGLYGEAAFSPPKAAIDEKYMRYAPQLIMSTTNHPWVVLAGVDKQAIWRRMDILVYVEAAPLDPKGHPQCRHCMGDPLDGVSSKHLADYHHVTFTICNKLEHKSYLPSALKLTFLQFKNYCIEFLTPIFNKNREVFQHSIASSMSYMSEAGDVEDLSQRIIKLRCQMLAEFERDYAIQWSDFTPKNTLNYVKRISHQISNAFDISKFKFRRNKTASELEDFDDLDIGEFKESATPQMENVLTYVDEAELKLRVREKNIGMGSDRTGKHRDHNAVATRQPINHNMMFETELFNAISENGENGIVMQIYDESILIRNDFAVNGHAYQITIKHFVAAYFSYFRHERYCIHCDPKFLAGHYYDGYFHYNRSSKCKETEYCEEWCIYQLPKFGRLFAKYYMHENAMRKRNLIRKQKPFIPTILHDGMGETGWRQNLKNFWEQLVCVLKASVQREGIIARLFNKVKKILVWLRNFMEVAWPILLPIIVSFTGYRAWNKHFSKSEAEIKGYLKRAAIEQVKQEAVTTSWAIHADYLRNLPHDDRQREILTHYSEGLMNRLPALPQHNHYTNDVGRVPRIVNAQARNMKVSKAAATQQSGSQQASVAEKLYRKQAVWIISSYVDEHGHIMENKFMCVHIRGNQLLILRHYWEKWRTNPKDTEYRFRYVENPERISHIGQVGRKINILDCPYHEMYYDEDENGKPLIDCNWMIVLLPADIPPAKNLAKFFARRAEHKYVGRNIMFVRPGESTHILPVKKNPMAITMAAIRGGQELHMEETYLYDREQAGYCGTAIMSGDLQRPIIGFHVAEWDKKGCAEPIYGEAFDLEPTPSNPVVDVCEMVLQPVDLANIDIDTVIYPQGTVPANMAINQSSETQYVESLIHGQLCPVETEPMPLSSRDPRMNGLNPMKLGVEKHGMASLNFPRKNLNAARGDLENKILAHCKPVINTVGVLDLQTAICGDAMVPQFTPMNWASSEGFPLIKARPPSVTGKSYLFDLELQQGGYILKGMNSELKRILEVQMEMRKRGIRPDTIYVDCLKDELRPIEKARTPGKTRVFSTCPIQYLIPFKQYFGDFMASYKNNRITAEHGIGINVDGPEWGRVAHYLQEKGGAICAGDYSHFGYTLNANVMKAAFDIVLKWYDEYSTSSTHEQDQIVRGVLISEAINVKRICGNLVYMSSCGLASGFPMTDILNSMVNCLYIRLAWIEIMREPLMVFNIKCNVITYGDDLLINVTDDIKEKFNTQSMFEFFEQYLIKFTDCDKSGKIIPYRTIDTAPFLKRNFVPHPTRPGQYLASLDPVSIHSCLNWCIAKDDPMLALVENCRGALTLAYGSGPEFYEQLRSNIQKKLREYNHNFLSIDWYTYDEKAYSC